LNLPLQVIKEVSACPLDIPSFSPVPSLRQVHAVPAATLLQNQSPRLASLSPTPTLGSTTPDRLPAARPAACLLSSAARRPPRRPVASGSPEQLFGIGECPGSATVASAAQRKPRIYLPPRRGTPRETQVRARQSQRSAMALLLLLYSGGRGRALARSSSDF
jgi:hypothetical protein